MNEDEILSHDQEKNKLMKLMKKHVSSQKIQKLYVLHVMIETTTTTTTTQENQQTQRLYAMHDKLPLQYIKLKDTNILLQKKITKKEMPVQIPEKNIFLQNINVSWSQTVAMAKKRRRKIGKKRRLIIFINNPNQKKKRG